jgi:hypothetical protein
VPTKVAVMEWLPAVVNEPAAATKEVAPLTIADEPSTVEVVVSVKVTVPVG